MRSSSYIVEQFTAAGLESYRPSCRSMPMLPIRTISQRSTTRPGSVGDVVLIDLWSRDGRSHASMADFTWTAYCGDVVPVKVREVFEVVRAGRPRWSFLESGFHAGATVPRVRGG